MTDTGNTSFERRRLHRSWQPGLPVSQRLVLAAVGATPVSLIGVAASGLLSLKLLAIVVLMPALAMLAVVILENPAARPLVASAILLGVVATVLYDLFRWSFLLVGLMDRDPIPDIGSSLGLEPGWLSGYLWRYVGNGGGLAIVFLVAGRRGTATGTVFGLLVCSGLLGVLVFTPHGQDVLFPLGPATLVVAVVGHIIYGGSLGLMSRFLLLPPGAVKVR